MTVTAPPPTPTPIPPTPIPPTETPIPPTPIPPTETPTPPTPTPPDKVSTPTLTPGDRSLLVEWHEPNTGDAPIERYGVEYKVSTDSSWTSAPDVLSGTSTTITGLVNGTAYHVHVRAKNSVGWGRWSWIVEETPRTTPGQVSTPTLTPGDGSLSASWTAPSNGGATITRYEVQYKLSTVTTWTSAGSVSFATQKTITGLTNGTSYRVRVRACNGAGDAWCGTWSRSATETPKATLVKPTDFDLRPLPRRWAELTWTGDPNADGYVVEVRKAGGTWDTPVPGDRSSGLVSTNQYRVELDRVAQITAPGKDELGNAQDYINYIGLAAGSGAYSFRVTATDSTGANFDSSHSNTVMIIDNPIVRADGNSQNAPSGEGQTSLVWKRAANVIDGRYKIRTRKLYPPEHHEINWAIWFYDLIEPAIGCEFQPCFSLPEIRVIDPDPTGPSGGRLTYTRTKLELGELYGIQINYDVRSGGDTIHVFSANDVYVWPSKGLPSEDNRPDRVATFPFFGRHLVICRCDPGMEHRRGEAIQLVNPLTAR